MSKDGHKGKSHEICLVSSLKENKVLINVGNRRIRALLDTGASITIVSQEFLGKACYKDSPLLSAKHPKVKGVTENYLKVLGMLELEIFIDGMVFVHSVHVIQDLHYAFILGLDFLRTNHANIDYATNTLNIDTKTNMHVCPIIADTGLARAIGNVIILKRSETTIRVKISRCVEGEEVLLEPVPALALKHILLLNALSRCTIMVHI